MRRSLRTLVMCIFWGFIGLTLWRVVVQGVMEKPSFDAPHLEAGAGDWGLIVQFLIAAFAFLFAALWFFIEPRWSRKAQALGLAIVTPILFAFSVRGLQRFAPGYSEAAFQRLAASHHSQNVLQFADVTSA
ncbi:MAG: hypothetical protein ACR2H1_03390, partial [Limisphaerales bacterium]